MKPVSDMPEIGSASLADRPAHRGEAWPALPAA